MRGSVALQTISLGALFMLAAFLVFSAIALFSGFFSAHLQKSAFTQRLINRLSALVFAGLALRLLLSER
jgi:threonine/homoserine/homoserine lactone efflux protein